MTVELDGAGVTILDVVAVARHGERVRLGEAALARMEAARNVVETLAEGEPAYGISTGFGALANTTVPVGRRAVLQRSLIRSHAAGMGPPIEAEAVRAMMFLRARTLALGVSGARPVVAESLVRLINAGVVPAVPEHGSLGASGDLAPLAHAALVLMGEGEVLTGRGTVDASEALAREGIEPLELAEKEGLALTNGTDGILGVLCLAVHDLSYLLTVADIVAACTVEALLATIGPSRLIWWGCGPIPVSRRAPPTCGPCWPDRPSSRVTAAAMTGCRTPTPSDAPPRCMAQFATPSGMWRR